MTVYYKVTGAVGAAETKWQQTRLMDYIEGRA
jgi:hypothetical protein